MARASWIDPGQTLGVPKVTHPISGEERRSYEAEKILGFARRHGWEITDVSDPEGYLTEAWLTKDDDRVRLTLWPGRSQALCTALINRITLPQRQGFPMQERVEAYLSGTKCTCTFVPHALVSEAAMIEDACPIHSDAA